VILRVRVFVKNFTFPARDSRCFPVAIDDGGFRIGRTAMNQINQKLKGTLIIVNHSGRVDKDVAQVDAKVKLEMPK
jgi:hypothetical protein